MIGLAVDLGGSHASCALVEDARVLRKSFFAIEAADYISFPSVLRAIVAHLKILCHEEGVSSSQASGVLFGFPGVVDSRASRVVATNRKFDGARFIDLPAWSQESLQTKLFLENDARAAMIGEHYCGAARGFEDAALISLGTGIGSAVILSGKPLRGASDRAGYLGGHLPIKLHGRLCGCGNVGCAEAEAATWALADIAKEDPDYSRSALRNIPHLRFQELFQWADKGDATANRLLRHCYAVWSALAVAILHAYSPQVLLFCGGVMARGEQILQEVRRHVTKHAWDMDGNIIRSGSLGSEAALLAAIPRILEG